MNKIILLVCSLLIYACSPKSENNLENSFSDSSGSSYTEDTDEEDFYNEEETNRDLYECALKDGAYSAVVDYRNDETDYTAQYTLEVEVQDCQVVQINFPNDGYLDDDHITYTNIDENGRASVEGENGKSYDVQILVR